MPSRRACLAAALAAPALGLPGAPRAQEGGRIILRVAGRIAAAHGPEGAGFDLAALEALGASELVTVTPWTRGAAIRFGGVLLARLLDAVGAVGGTLRASALNDYVASFPAAEARRDGAFLATRADGQPLRVRDKGPVWIVFPWSARPELDVALVHERSVWQLRRIDVA